MPGSFFILVPLITVAAVFKTAKYSRRNAASGPKGLVKKRDLSFQAQPHSCKTARKLMYNYIDNIDNEITGVYSGYKVSWEYGGEGNNPFPINCEHTVPQSFFKGSSPVEEVTFVTSTLLLIAGTVYRSKFLHTEKVKMEKLKSGLEKQVFPSMSQTS